MWRKAEVHCQQFLPNHLWWKPSNPALDTPRQWFMALQEQLLTTKCWKEMYLIHSTWVPYSWIVPWQHSFLRVFHTTHRNAWLVHWLDLTYSWQALKPWLQEVSIPPTDLNYWRWHSSFGEETSQLWPRQVGEEKQKFLVTAMEEPLSFPKDHLSTYAAEKLDRFSCLQLLAQPNYVWPRAVWWKSAREMMKLGFSSKAIQPQEVSIKRQKLLSSKEILKKHPIQDKPCTGADQWGHSHKATWKDTWRMDCNTEVLVRSSLTGTIN